MTTSTRSIATQSDALSALSGITHGFFTRNGGVSKGIFSSLNAGLGSGDDRNSVKENRSRICNFLDVDAIASPYQVHSADCIVTEKPWNDERPEADALVTTTPGLAIGIVTADCGPVLFADPKARVIGAAHAGWQGALNGVLQNTISQMEAAGAKRENITAILGPTISQKNYEVGPEFHNRFLAQITDNAKYFIPSKTAHHFMFDLQAYIADQLNQAGVSGSALSTCTYGEEENYFSYRRTTHRKEADYGRQLSAIVLA